jgi:hypothetical protein
MIGLSGVPLAIFFSAINFSPLLPMLKPNTTAIIEKVRNFNPLFYGMFLSPLFTAKKYNLLLVLYVSIRYVFSYADMIIIL